MIRLSAVAVAAVILSLAPSSLPANIPSSPLSVRDFGAKADGVADDTAAIQATVDAAIRPGDPKKKARSGVAAVRLPAGTYRITAPIVLRSIQKLKISGDGIGLTSFAVAGQLPAALELDGVALCTFTDFSIKTVRDEGGAVNSFDAGIFLHWNRENSYRSNTNSRFYNIEVAGRFKVGFQIGAPGANNQVDQTQWFGCRVLGAWKRGEETWWQSGWRVGSGVFANNLAHAVYNVDANGLRYGMHVWASQVAVYGGLLQNNGADIYLESITSYCQVSGIRSESSERLLETGAGRSVGANVSIADILWRMKPEFVAADRRVISYRLGGALVLRNVAVTGYEGKGVRPKLFFSAEKKPLTVLVHGLTIGGDQTLSDVFETSGAVTIQASGLSQLGPGPEQVEHRVAPLRTITADVAVGGADEVLLVDASEQPIVVQLPSAKGCAGRKLHIKRVDSSDNQVTLRAADEESIDGDASRPLNRQHKAISVVSDDRRWLIL